MPAEWRSSRARCAPRRVAAAARAAPYESLAKRRGTRFLVELPPDPVHGLVDEEKLDRVLGNLLDNAFKFTPPGGTVSVKMRLPAGGWASIEVEDTGPGIRDQDLPHVFERFYRGGQETGPMPGTGIGLALAKECVELHGGEIGAENRPEGGTRFSVRLRTTPAEPGAGLATAARVDTAAGADEHATESADDDRPAPGQAVGADRATILIVDDNADMRAYLRKHLDPLYNVLEAARGDEGLAKVRAELPDAIVCDVMMPGMDGYAFCRAVRSDPDTDFLPVVLLTAKAGPEGRLEGLAEGADDYLTKPFQPAELLARIRNLLHGRERLKARFAAQPAGALVLASPRQAPSADADLPGQAARRSRRGGRRRDVRCGGAGCGRRHEPGPTASARQGGVRFDARRNDHPSTAWSARRRCWPSGPATSGKWPTPSGSRTSPTSSSDSASVTAARPPPTWRTRSTGPSLTGLTDGRTAPSPAVCDVQHTI